MNKLLISVWLLILLIGAVVVFIFAKPLKSTPTKLVPPTAITETELKVKGKALPFPLQTIQRYTARLFSADIPNARDLQFTANNTLLVSSPATGSVYALRDTNNDGIAEEKKVILSGLNQPHGLAVYEGKLFVAEVTRVVRYTFEEKTLSAKQDRVLFQLPANANHNKRTLLIDKKGTMYISVGSTCNVCTERDTKSGTILISDVNGTPPRIYSSGLRNAPFMAFNPDNQSIWVTEMGRDNLGDNIPPDELNILQDGKNYGWPLCYGKRIHDTQFDTKKYLIDPCKNTEVPIFEIPAHSAPLGLAFIPETFSKEYAGDLLVAYHGSWNRSVPTGYKVVLMARSGDVITKVSDFLTGFTNAGEVNGRPGDITFDNAGSAFISDDKAGNIYIVTPQ